MLQSPRPRHPIRRLSTSSLTYTLQVTNNGPDTASAVIVTDVLPAGLNFVSVSPSNVCSGPPVNTNGTVTCTISSLAMGVSVPITIVTVPTASSGSAITNTVRVASNTSDPIQTNNEATAVVQVRAEADVAHHQDRCTQSGGCEQFVNLYPPGDEQRAGHGLRGDCYRRTACRTEFCICQPVQYLFRSAS